MLQFAECHAALALEVAAALVLWGLNTWVSTERIQLEIVSLDMCL